MTLPALAPSAVGVDPRGVLDLLDAAAHLDLHSLAIARDGHAIARGWWAPYGPDRRHLLYSVSKSVTATTLATLLPEGALALDDAVLDHLPPDVLAAAGELDPRWRSVTIRHCLTMTIGHTAEAWSFDPDLDRDLLLHLLANPPEVEPGTVFAYNQVATYLVSRALEHRFGAPLDVLARDRVLGPLGLGDIEWDTDGRGHPLGFSGARLRTDDLLALTQLWLDGGERDGAPFLPAGWVAEASQPFLPVPPDDVSDWAQGYGQSFWGARHGYRADGACGQYGLVLPEQRLAVAITSQVTDMQEVLDLVWEHLLPAVDRPGTEADDAALAARLAALQIPVLGSTAEGSTQTFALAEGTQLPQEYRRVAVGADGALTLQRDGGDLRIAVGDGAWTDGELAVDGLRLAVSASGGWTADGYVAEVRCVETPHSFRVDTRSGAADVRWRVAPLRSTDPLACAHV